MRYVKSYKKFQENAVATASSTSGSGPVVAAQPGVLPGTFGSPGSGDLGFTFKKEKRKKGNPSQVTDLRDLAPAKGVTKVKESNSESRDPNQNSEIRRVINDCVVELSPDSEFELTMIEYDRDREFVDLGDDDSDGGYIDFEELRISFHKLISQNWTGNYTVRCRFDKDGETNRQVDTLRARGSEMTAEEQMLFDMVEDSSIKLINSLDYGYGVFTIKWFVVGSAMPYDSKRNINVNVSIVLYNDLKN
jgi:hypothetical protein